MKKRTLGNTGLQVSPISIGAWQLGGPLAFDGQPDGHPDPGKENVLRMIQELGERGVNAIEDYLPALAACERPSLSPATREAIRVRVRALRDQH